MGYTAYSAIKARLKTLLKLSVVKHLLPALSLMTRKLGKKKTKIVLISLGELRLKPRL
jgi:hypothetical protein